MFAAARDAAGADSITVDVEDNARAAEVIEAIGKAVPEISGLLNACRLAVDCTYATADMPVQSASEVALIPPVSGG
ncbi:MAG: MoaD/ThiS family protein [Rubripirellula sp.]